MATHPTDDRRQHLVIRREDYVAGTRERPEVGVFTQTHSGRHPVPWGQISARERVWMKWAGGPVVATARVDGHRQLEAATPEALRATTQGFKLYDLASYWTSLPPVFFGLTVYLGNEEWLRDPFVPTARSRGESWVVVEGEGMVAGWLSGGPTEEDPRPRSGNSPRGRSRTIPLTLRFLVLRRDDFRCTYCGRRPPEVILHLDHKEPFSAGGLATAENLRTACQECNVGKSATNL